MKKYLTKYEWRWAAIYTLVILIWGAFEFEMGWHGEHIASHLYLIILFLLPAAIVYYVFLLDKRAHRFKKRMKWRHGFRSAMGLTFLTILMLIPVQILLFQLVTPDFFDNAARYRVEQGQLSPEQASKLFNPRTFAVIIPIAFTLLGLFLSIIIPFFTTHRSRI